MVLHPSIEPFDKYLLHLIFFTPLSVGYISSLRYPAVSNYILVLFCFILQTIIFLLYAAGKMLFLLGFIYYDCNISGESKVK